MTDESAALLKAISGKSTVKVLQGTFVSAAVGSCLVDVNGARIPAQLGTSWLPEVGETVDVWFVDGKPYLMGPSASKPDRGTVVSVASNLVTLNPAFGPKIIAPYAGSTPTAGQTMKILWHGGPMAFLMSTSPAGNAAPPNPGGGTSTHVDTFTAINAGSYNGRWWTNQVRADDSDLGAWFYGTKISDTIPSTAPVTRVEIFLRVVSLFGSAPIFGLHPHPYVPSGAPSLSGGENVSVSGSGWRDLDPGWGNYLKAGGGMFGVGLAHGGENIFAGLDVDGQSGAIRITSNY